MKHLSLKAIASGWANLAFPTEQSRRLFNHRIEICDSCPYKLQMTPLSRLVVLAVNDQANTYFCKKCMCPLATSLTIPLKSCPDGRFPAEENEDQ